MKIRKITNTDERAILTGMIVNTSVLSRVAAKWPKMDGMFRSEWSNLIGSWCVNFHRKYGKAPRKNIVGLFSRWAEKHPDKQLLEHVERFMSGLSRDYAATKRSINAEYLIDQASRYFNRVRLEKTRDEIEHLLSIGEVEKALSLIGGFHKVDMGLGSVIKVLNDKESIQRAFEESRESLIQYPGALGRFISPHLTRDALVAFMGKNKVGKSYWLGDLAWEAMKQRRKVAYFVLGDMSEGQVQMRFGTRATGLPRSKRKPIKFPVELLRPKAKGGEARVKRKARQYKKVLTWQRAWKAYQRCLNEDVRSKESYLRLVVLPAGGISVDGIDEQLELWAKDGWVADVCVIDYADNLDMPDGGDNPRDQHNIAWKKLRKLSQTRHMLVVTATQANAASFGHGDVGESRVLTRKNFTEDRRKLDHVTGMLGINQTPEEKAKGLYRINWIILREGDYNEYRCCHVASCLALARPCVLSTL